MPELDIAVLPSAEQIRRREFATIRRGYDPDQVRDYLYAVAEQLESLERNVHEAGSSAAQRAPVAAPTPAQDQPAVDPYETFAKKVAGLLGTADKEAVRLVEEAKRESSRIVEEARAEADRIRLDAQSNAEEARAEAERMLDEARAEAERALSGLAGRRQTLMDQLQTMQTRLLSAAKDLDVAIEDRPEDLPQPLVDAEAKAEAKATTDAPASEDDMVEPGYEDLWASSDEVGALSDLATMEFDFGTEERPAP
jgi:DivIVA domain-containing protein